MEDWAEVWAGGVDRRLGPVTLRLAEVWVGDMRIKECKKMEPIFIILIGLGIKSYFFCLALNYNAHLSIDVHCSNEAKKNSLNSTTR